VGAARQVNAHGPAAVGFERLDVAKRLRAFELRECVRRPWNRRLCLIVRRDDESDERVRSSFVILTRRVEVARPTPKVDATRLRARIDWRINATDDSVAGFAGRYERNAT
jgi:hypothetical protein